MRRLLAVLLFLLFADDAETTYAHHGVSPFFGWVHSIQYEHVPFKVRPFDLFLAGRARRRRHSRNGAKTKRVLPMRNAMLVQLVTLRRMVRLRRRLQGGDAHTASWQTYLMLSTIWLTFVVAQHFHTAAHYVLLAKALIASAIYRAVMLWYAYFRVVRPGLITPFPEFVTSHDDSVLWVGAILIVIVDALHRRSLARDGRGAVLLFVLFLGAILWNTRRLAWVSLGAGGVAILALIPQGRMRTASRGGTRSSAGRCSRSTSGIGMGSTSRIFRPLQAISTVSTQEDASTKARNVENLGLIATAHAASPWIGTGWGEPYISLSNKYSIAQKFELWQNEPHNSILGLLAFTGVFGFTGYWLAFPTAVFLNARVARLARSAQARNCGVIGVALLIVCANQLYGDMGLFYHKPMYVLSVCFAMAMRLPAAEGVWRRRALSRASDPAPNRAMEPTERERMAKLILLSVVLVGFLVPISLSTRRAPRRALRQAQIAAAAFVIVWAYMCLTWYPQLVPLGNVARDPEKVPFVRTRVRRTPGGRCPEGFATSR